MIKPTSVADPQTGVRYKAVPSKGLDVFHPVLNAHLPSEGAAIVFNGYWQRRLQDNDITLFDDKEKS